MRRPGARSGQWRHSRCRMACDHTLATSPVRAATLRKIGENPRLLDHKSEGRRSTVSFSVCTSARPDSRFDTHLDEPAKLSRAQNGRALVVTMPLPFFPEFCTRHPRFLSIECTRRESVAAGVSRARYGRTGHQERTRATAEAPPPTQGLLRASAAHGTNDLGPQALVWTRPTNGNLSRSAADRDDHFVTSVTCRKSQRAGGNRGAKGAALTPRTESLTRAWRGVSLRQGKWRSDPAPSEVES